MRNRLDFARTQHVVQSIEFREFDRDIFGRVQFLLRRFICAACEKHMRYRVRARRIGHERTHVLDRSRGIAGFFKQFARSRLLRIFAFVYHARHQLEQRSADAVLVLPHQHHLAVVPQCENNHESAALAYVIIVDDGAVGQHDAIAAHPQVRTVQYV